MGKSLEKVVCFDLTETRVRYLMSCVPDDMTFKVPVSVPSPRGHGSVTIGWAELSLTTGEYYTCPDLEPLQWGFDRKKELRGWLEHVFRESIIQAHTLDLVNRTSFIEKLKLLMGVNQKDTWAQIIIEAVFNYKAFMNRFLKEVEFRWQLIRMPQGMCRQR